ncbi:MAG: hypothetical protein K2H06_01785, partial [Anaeroplasmataceae bacterium]|nr:hypothetical protein [Anaeroplasmataceae bacterium]
VQRLVPMLAMHMMAVRFRSVAPIKLVKSKKLDFLFFFVNLKRYNKKRATTAPFRLTAYKARFLIEAFLIFEVEVTLWQYYKLMKTFCQC